MVPVHKSRRYIALPRETWRRLDELAHAAGRRPGEALRVVLERYFAALDRGGPVQADPTDALVSRPR